MVAPQYVQEPDHASALPELSTVRLTEPFQAGDGSTLPAGAPGTIVAVLGEGEAYMVEFVEPFAALVTVRARQVRAVDDDRP